MSVIFIREIILRRGERRSKMLAASSDALIPSALKIHQRISSREVSAIKFSISFR
jgi:hypothetical protein